jgi:hemerythrin-like domain-containing protein
MTTTNATANLKLDHLTVRRIRDIAQTCSNRLYDGNTNVPIEDMEIISVVIEEFVDRFHQGKRKRHIFPKLRPKITFQRISASS